VGGDECARALKGIADAGSDGIIQISTGGAEYASGPTVKNMVTGAITWVSVKYPSGAKAGGAARPWRSAG